MKNQLYILIFISFSLKIAFTQSPYFINHEFGDNNNSIKIEKIFEDQTGIIWAGTKDGLYSFDGIEFTQFLKSDSSSNHVRSIFQDQNKIIWIGYQDGSIYQLSSNKLVEWQIEEGHPSSPIIGFAEDGENRLWIATYGEGVYYKTNHHLYNISTDDGLLGDDIYVVKPCDNGKIWVGTDGGISICSIENSKKTIKNITKKEGLPDEIVKEIIADEKGNFWIGTYDNGFCYYNMQKESFEHQSINWKGERINCMELYEDNELWIGTNGNGIKIYSLKDKSLKNLDNDDFVGAKINDLHKDMEGNIWASSNTKGLSHANRQFSHLKIDLKNIQCILSDSHENLWAGTKNGLFIQLKNKRQSNIFEKKLKRLNINVVSLFEDKYNNIWIGTFGEGIYIFNEERNKIRHLDQKDGLTNDNILSIKGIDNKIWLASLGGVMEVEANVNLIENKKISIRNYNHESALGTNFIYTIFIDSKNRVWFGTDGKGISYLENGKIINYYSFFIEKELKNRQNPIPIGAVYCITEDNIGNIWFSTAKNGIFKFDGKKLNQFTETEGIRDLDITSLITDKKGNILIIHPTGIDVFDPINNHFIYYDQDIGIENIDPNLNAVCTGINKHIWIGLNNGIVEYLPLNEQLEIHPRTQLKDVSIFLEPIDFTNTNSFSHNQNNLVFDYLGLWYSNPSSVSYRYKLDGYDQDWISSKDRKATYSNLPHGGYTFKVSSSINNKWNNNSIKEYNFSVAPPLWKRGWFILSSLLIGGMLFYWYQKQRDARLQNLNLLEKEKAKSELAALKAQINPHFLFNSFNTLVAVIEEDSNSAVQYVEKLSDFYRSMLQYRNTEVISIQEELGILDNYIYLLRQRFGKNLFIKNEIKKEQFYLVPLSLQILIENAVKHNIISTQKPLNIIIRLEEDEYISVENNLQLKLNAESSTQFGLQSLTKRYELLTGKSIIINKTDDSFKIQIPILNKKINLKTNNSPNDENDNH